VMLVVDEQEQLTRMPPPIICFLDASGVTNQFAAEYSSPCSIISQFILKRRSNLCHGREECNRIGQSCSSGLMQHTHPLCIYFPIQSELVVSANPESESWCEAEFGRSWPGRHFQARIGRTISNEISMLPTSASLGSTALAVRRGNTGTSISRYISSGNRPSQIPH
jgi:hypothetical protein